MTGAPGVGRSGTDIARTLNDSRFAAAPASRAALALLFKRQKRKKGTKEFDLLACVVSNGYSAQEIAMEMPS
jgi:hypothetical protein